MNGIYSLEEYYAKGLQAYYDALDMGASHNYYLGREDADLTSWIDYFCGGMAEAFAAVRLTLAKAVSGDDQKHLLRDLDQRQKRVLELFRRSRFVTTAEIADQLPVHRRTALNLCNKWANGGFLILHGEAKKSRRYELAGPWLQLID